MPSSASERGPRPLSVSALRTDRFLRLSVRATFRNVCLGCGTGVRKAGGKIKYMQSYNLRMKMIRKQEENARKSSREKVRAMFVEVSLLSSVVVKIYGHECMRARVGIKCE